MKVEQYSAEAESAIKGLKTGLLGVNEGLKRFNTDQEGLLVLNIETRGSHIHPQKITLKLRRCAS